MAGTKPGPARKPALQVVREGNPRQHKIRHEVRMPPGAPDPPSWDQRVPPGPSSDRVRARCQELWELWAGVLDPMGLLSPSHGPYLADACVTMAWLEEHQAAVAAEGAVVEGRQGGLVRNPRLMEIAELRRAARVYAGMFGLVPGMALEAREDAKAADPDADV